MKKSAYINYLIENLDNTLYQLHDKDRSDYYNYIHNRLNNSASQYSHDRLKDFFDFYLNTLECTPKELIDLFGKSRNKVIDLIYDANYSHINFRKELKNTFQPAIESDIELFQHALFSCLKTHLEFEMRATAADDPYYSKILLEQETINFELFTDLIEIGKKQKFFNKLNIELLHTKNERYKNLFIENNLLDNDSFSEEHFINLIKEAYCTNVQNHKRTENQTKFNEYKMHYLNEILDCFPSPDIFKFWSQENLSYKNDKNENLFYMNEIDFLKNIVSEVTPSSKPIQKKFLNDWLKSSSIKNFILNHTHSYYETNEIFKYFPDQTITLLNSLSEVDMKSVIEKMDYSLLDFDRNSFSRSFIHNIVDITTKQSIKFQNMPIILEKIMELKQYSTETIIFDAIENHLFSKFITKINSSQITSEEKNENIKSLIKIYQKNSDINFNGLTALNDQLPKYLENSTKILTQIYLLKNELHNEKYIANLEHKIKEQTTQFFSDTQELLKNSNSYYYTSKKQEKNFNIYLDILNKINCANDSVDINKLFSLFFDKEESNTNYNNGKRKTTTKVFSDFPAIFHISLDSKNPQLLNKIFKDENLLELEKIQYKKKTFLDYCLENKPEIVPTLIDTIKNEPNLVNSFILSKKKTLNKLRELNNEFINKTIDFVLLEQKLPTNSAAKTKIVKM